MLNENTLERLTEMMELLTTRAIRRKIGVAADLLCWTPLAPLIRASRRARIESQTTVIRLREKASGLCEEAIRDNAELLVPAWG
jgi:hypothetical protein